MKRFLCVLILGGARLIAGPYTPEIWATTQVQTSFAQASSTDLSGTLSIGQQSVYGLGIAGPAVGQRSVAYGAISVAANAYETYSDPWPNYYPYPQASAKVRTGFTDYITVNLAIPFKITGYFSYYGSALYAADLSARSTLGSSTFDCYQYDSYSPCTHQWLFLLTTAVNPGDEPVKLSISVDVNAFPNGSGYYGGQAYSQMDAHVTRFEVSDLNGNLLSGYTYTAASGTHYDFSGGIATPEPGSLAFGGGAAVVAFVATTRRRGAALARQ